MEEIDDVGDNAFLRGFLNKKYCDEVVDRLNLWLHMKVKTGSTARGSAKFIVSKDGVTLDLSLLKFATTSAAGRLQLSSANTATVPKIRVTLGYVAGQIADAGMTDPTDSPPFLLTLASAVDTKYIYCAVTMAYDVDTGIWARDPGTPNAIGASSLPPASRPNTATIIYVYLGTVAVTANVAPATGYAASIINQVVSGDQGVARHGPAFYSGMPDYNWLI